MNEISIKTQNEIINKLSKTLQAFKVITKI